MRSDEERLRDMLEACERIMRYASRGKAAFDGDELLQTWMLHNLQLIGEAARALSSEFRDTHPQIPWKQIIGMRTILVHHYFEIDTEAVWAATVNDVPSLRAIISSLLNPQTEP